MFSQISLSRFMRVLSSFCLTTSFLFRPKGEEAAEGRGPTLSVLLLVHFCFWSCQKRGRRRRRRPVEKTLVETDHRSFLWHVFNCFVFSPRRIFAKVAAAAASDLSCNTFCPFFAPSCLRFEPPTAASAAILVGASFIPSENVLFSLLRLCISEPLEEFSR